MRDLLPSPKVRSTPPRHRPAGHSVVEVWALPRSLAATGGISLDFSAEGTEMFQFPCGPPSRVTLTGGVSPFGYRRIKGCKTPPRRFRCQAPSFIGSAAPGHSPCAVNYLRVLARARLPFLLCVIMHLVRFRASQSRMLGGPCWSRTSDLSLIRTALSPAELKAPTTTPVLPPLGGEGVEEGGQTTLPVRGVKRRGHSLAFSHGTLPSEE